jgi:hypothetical protein
VLKIAKSLRQVASLIACDDTGEIGSILSGFATRISSSTAVKVPIDSTTDVDDFVRLHTGNNLRLETIALLYAMSARILIPRSWGRRSHTWDADFVPALVRSAVVCINLARDIAPETNDVMAWASFEVCRLHLILHGETCK